MTARIFERRQRYEDVVVYLYTQLLTTCLIKAWKLSGLNGIRANDLCDTSAVLYQLAFLVQYVIKRRQSVDFFVVLIKK